MAISRHGERGKGWRTSSYSNNGTCVEVADLPDGARLVRDTKNGTDGPVLRYTAAEWEAFIAGVKAASSISC